MSALAILGAVVPSVVSIGVAASFLCDYAQGRREFDLRSRLLASREAHLERVRVAFPGDSARYQREREVSAKVEKRMLGYHGLSGEQAAYAKVQVMANMQRPLVPVREIARQWILIGGAVAGVVLVSIDAWVSSSA